MPKLDKDKARRRIESIFKRYSKLEEKDYGHLAAATDGKLYELYVLSEVLKELKRRGFRLRLNGTSIRFKASPGKVNPSDPHFDVFAKGASHPVFKIYTDVEVTTLGAEMSGCTGNSTYHEIDILVVRAGVAGNPSFQDVALGVECKAHDDFKKSVVREVLGLRREMSLLRDEQLSVLSQHQTKRLVNVPAYPPSELWLAYIDPKGNSYSDSPRAFGIEFKHLQP